MTAAIRLFSPHEEAPPPPTLQDAWQQWLRPGLVRSGRSAGTLADYERAIRRFSSWWREHHQKPLQPAGCKERIAYPLLADAGRQELTAFRDWFTDAGGGSPRSANKVVQAIEAVLIAAADNQEESGYQHQQNRLKPLETAHAARKFYLSYEQLDALYLHAGAAAWPDAAPALPGGRIRAPLPFTPAQYYRAALVMWFNYGLRTQELIAYTRGVESLTWGQIYLSVEETPAEEGQATNAHGWFYYTPQKQKRLKPDPLVLPLSAVALAHLQSIRPPDPLPSTRVFPFPYSSDSFYAAWRRITEAAGVAPKKNLRTGEQGEYLPKHLRKTCETWHDTQQAGIGPVVTGHAERSVSGRHYVNREWQLVQAVNALPQPGGFQQIFTARTSAQRQLF